MPANLPAIFVKGIIKIDCVALRALGLIKGIIGCKGANMINRPQFNDTIHVTISTNGGKNCVIRWGAGIRCDLHCALGRNLLTGQDNLLRVQDLPAQGDLAGLPVRETVAVGLKLHDPWLRDNLQGKVVGGLPRTIFRSNFSSVYERIKRQSMGNILRYSRIMQASGFLLTKLT